MAKETDQVEARSDEEVLILSLKTPSLFSVLVDRYRAAFSRRAAAVIGWREEVDDVVVEAFAKIYFHAPGFRPQPGASFRSWAHKILLNTAKTYYRRLREREAAEVLVPREAFVGFVAKEGASLNERLAAVLTRMPTAMARALRLHFLEGYPQAEVARLEGLSLGAIKSRIYRAKKIFKTLSHYGDF